MKRDTGVGGLCAWSSSSGLQAIVLSTSQTDFHFQTDKSHLKARQLYQHTHLTESKSHGAGDRACWEILFKT